MRPDDEDRPPAQLDEDGGPATDTADIQPATEPNKAHVELGGGADAPAGGSVTLWGQYVGDVLPITGILSCGVGPPWILSMSPAVPYWITGPLALIQMGASVFLVIFTRKKKP